jgi:hypothetical protein
MKKHLFLILIPVLALLSACGEQVETISQAEAAELVENATVANTEGYVSQVEDISGLLLAFLDNCNETRDSSISRSGSQGNVSYNWNFDWSWSLACSNVGVPQSFSASYSGSGDYSTLRITSDDEFSGSFTVSGLQPSAGNWVYSGSYSRTGSQVFDGQRRDRDVSSVITVSTTNLNVSKSSQEIVSGTSDISVSGSVNGSAFSYTGTLVFNGNRTGTLTINGSSYNISW